MESPTTMSPQKAMHGAREVRIATRVPTRHLSAMPPLGAATAWTTPARFAQHNTRHVSHFAVSRQGHASTVMRGARPGPARVNAHCNADLWRCGLGLRPSEDEEEGRRPIERRGGMTAATSRRARPRGPKASVGVREFHSPVGGTGPLPPLARIPPTRACEIRPSGCPPQPWPALALAGPRAEGASRDGAIGPRKQRRDESVFRRGRRRARNELSVQRANSFRAMAHTARSRARWCTAPLRDHAVPACPPSLPRVVAISRLPSGTILNGADAISNSEQWPTIGALSNSHHSPWGPLKVPRHIPVPTTLAQPPLRVCSVVVPLYVPTISVTCTANGR